MSTRSRRVLQRSSHFRRTSARRCSPSRSQGHQRQGSTLMIVIVLLGLLSVLGVLFYSFANQERSNAEYYAEAARIPTSPGLTADTLMDHALEQLILGAPSTSKNSVLWGKRHSLIANAMGLQEQALTDLTAFNGQGVKLSMGTSGQPFVDQDQNGMADGGQVIDAEGNAVFTNNNGSSIQDLLRFNDSPAANGLFERPVHRFPQPDVGYTYPDQNNLFLAYLGYARDRTTGQVRKVIIPSFHRPQLNRDVGGVPYPLYEDFNYDNTMAAAEDRNSNSTLDYGSEYPNQQFRAHPSHLYVMPGQRPGNASSRYIRTASEATTLLGDAKRVFPFLPMYAGYQPQDNGSGGVDLVGRPGSWIGHQGVWSGPHPADSGYSTPANPLHDEYQYDVDNDGDGINEGVWLDLDFPVQEMADGTLYVPMFSFTVYDLDGLLNLNIHGNIQNLLFQPGNYPFNNATLPFGTNGSTGNLDFISASNMGLQAAEVNPAWALTGRAGIDCPVPNIGTVFDQYRRFYGRNPQDATSLGSGRNSFLETANMDLAYLKFGRPKLTTTSTVEKLFAGLYGEEHLIAANFSAGSNNAIDFPHPGQSQTDDNGDINEDMQFAAGYVGGTVRNWLDVDQPRDTIGMGSMRSSTDVKLLDRTNPTAPSSHLKWLRYSAFASNNNVQWGDTNLLSGNLMLNKQAYGLFDDPAEVALYAEDQRDVDEPFTPEDTAFLAMSNNDIKDATLATRLEDLASFNFSTDDTVNGRGEEIRKRFTTQANDRKSFSLPRAPGTSGRVWEWTTDNGDVPQNAGTESVRFPPTFGDVGSAIQRYSGQDPFRAPVRTLLEATPADLQSKAFQQRLNINQVLVYDWKSPNSTELIYRDLTLHPTDPGATAIPTTIPQYQPSYPWSSAASQEFWARRDRQMLARDIYVLLYLLGGGEDGSPTDNPLRTGWTNSYTPQQLEQMARFAVNLVDAQDKDRVMTRFEYDADLSNGWNLDDNPYTIDTSTDRREVWGQERQELALNEFLAFRTTAEMADSANTEHTDDEERQFMCVELRNLAPYEIRFADTAEWQFVLRHPSSGMERRLTLKNGAGTVAADGFFTLYSTDRNDPAKPYNPTMNPSPSAFRVNPDGSSGMEWIVPRDTAFNTPPNASNHHLDVVAAIAANPTTPPFEITDENDVDQISGAGSEGAMLTLGMPATGGGPGNFVIGNVGEAQMILRRRAHPTRTRPTSGSATDEEDNPWIEIDRIVYPAAIPAFDYPDSGANAVPQLALLLSQQRREPLLAGSIDTTTTGNIRNTFSSGTAAENQQTTADYTAHQIHYDRKFVSLGELLNVPLIGPSSNFPPGHEGVSHYLQSMQKTPYAQYGLPASGTFQNYAKTAGGMFLLPDYPNSINGDPWRDNRWYRLLEFIEIPSRQNRNLGVGTEFEVKRVPGKINLNMLRYPEVLAALIDDERLLDFDPSNPSTAVPANPHAIELPRVLSQTDAAIELFEQLQNSRDPVDPYWQTQGADLRLPGIAPDLSQPLHASPFQSLAYSQAGNESLQHTLLRDMPIDSSETSKRQLFEVGTQADHASADPTVIDPALRYQMLSKIWNNTTVRSNTFVVFVSVKLFRAAQAPGEDLNGDGILQSAEDTNGNGVLDEGAVRIGGPLKEFTTGTLENPELPEYRGVFVVDRSLIEKGVSTGGGGFTDFRPFVTYRRILKEE